jgi:hypothetical protein
MRQLLLNILFAPLLAWWSLFIVLVRGDQHRAMVEADRREVQKRLGAAMALSRHRVQNLTEAVENHMAGNVVDFDRWPVRSVLNELPALRHEEDFEIDKHAPAPAYPTRPLNNASAVELLAHLVRILLYRIRWG